MSKQKDWLIGMGIIFGCLILIVILLGHLSNRKTSTDVRISGSGEKIAVIELNGVIYESRSVTRQFKKYGDDKSIKAIVFYINSPGGGIVPSQEIYEAVKRVRDNSKPVVATMSSVGASGGYYVALGADTIMANPGTTTGSIGVIAEFMNTEGLMDKIGVSFEVIKSGRFKDTGSPYREMTSAERQYLQDYVMDAYNQFVEAVSIERNMDESEVRKLADGRVYTGNQAIQNGLIDLLGDYEDAIDVAAGLAGIGNDPTIIKEAKRRSSIYDLFFERIRGMFHLSDGMHLQYRMVW